MTRSSVAFSDASSSTEAGTAIGTALKHGLEGAAPHAVILFVSARHEYDTLLSAVMRSCDPGILIGCSSAGEFINGHTGTHAVSAIALHSSDILFQAGVGEGVSENVGGAARQILSTFGGASEDLTRYRSALVLTDALSGYADDLISELSAASGGAYTFFGGGAGDDARFSHTHVFLGTDIYNDAAVALELLSTKPIGIGVEHGWEKDSPPLRVTESAGMRLVGLDGAPAVEAVGAYASSIGQAFDASDPLPFFLHHVLGVETGAGVKLRVPLGVDEQGALLCAAEVPEGAVVYIMRTSHQSAADAAASATREAVRQLQGREPEVALFFDCVATRLRLGSAFELELDALQAALGQARYAGCNTYGQIARAPGQFSGFHNCTAVVCVLPS